MIKKFYFIVMLIISYFLVNAIKVEGVNITEKGDFIYFWSNDPRTNEPINQGTLETYAEADRRWQGLPTIAITSGGRIWVSWQTGDSIEGSAGVNNYNVLYYSDDNGKTWSENYLIWDVNDQSIRLTDPRLFIDNHGRLWLILIRGGLKGVYAIEILNPDCDNPVEELQFAEPLFWLNYPPAHRVTILSNGAWVTPVESQVARQVTYYCMPDHENRTYIWHQITSQPAITAYPDNKTYGEAQIIELLDGRLMMLSRLPAGVGGGMEVAYSDDYGATWSKYQANLGEPYITPGSKFHIQRLKSGAILLVTNASTKSRANLTAYLSYDDGKTYPYTFIIDDRDMGNKWGISYPEVAQQQGENGEIYIVYDAGRYDQKEIRLTIITEEDIKAGKPVSEYYQPRIVISKLGNFIDFVDTVEKYEQYMTVDLGTTKETILSNLPREITLVDEYGESMTFTGTWSSLDYNSTTEGRYVFTFSATIPNGYQDLHSKFKVYVIVQDLSKIPDNDQPDDDNDDGDVINPEIPESNRYMKYIIPGGLIVLLLIGGTIYILKKFRLREDNV